MAGRAAVLIVFSDVHKVAFVEATLSLAVGGQRLGHQRRHPGLVAIQNLFAFEVAAISNDGQIFLSRRIACLRGHREQLGAVMADVGDFVGDDQMMLGIHRGLDVVADHAGAPATGGHRAGIRIGQRDLPVGGCLQLLSNLLQVLHVRLDRGDLLLEPRNSAFRDQGRLPIRTVELGQIPADAFLQLRHALLELVVGEVLVAVVDRLELAAVDRHDRFGEQIEPTAQHDEFATDVTDRLAVVPAKVSDGLEVRRQAPRQPHQLNVALGLALQTPTGLQVIEIPVDVDPQQHRRVVRGTPGLRRRHAVETKASQIQFVDEDIDHTHRVVRDDKVVKTLGQQRHLSSVLAFDESLHATTPNKPDASV